MLWCPYNRKINNLQAEAAEEEAEATAAEQHHQVANKLLSLDALWLKIASNH